MPLDEKIHPQVAVIIPIKSFNDAKERLADVLIPNERIALAKFCAQRVVQAARPFAVYVICDDQTVAIWAEANGAKVIWQTEPGLNNAAQQGVKTLRAHGFDLALVAHSDLPLATHFDHLIENRSSTELLSTITLVPDRHEDGTNILIVPTSIDFEFKYGHDSFHAHQLQAKLQNIEPIIIFDQRLAIDIDCAEDLAIAHQYDKVIIST